VPVFVDNDVNALGAGRMDLRSRPGVRSLVMLALGTGIGGGLV
jgi:predicted NBD/HSP70 family sugar kinase